MKRYWIDPTSAIDSWVEVMTAPSKSPSPIWWSWVLAFCVDRKRWCSCSWGEASHLLRQIDAQRISKCAFALCCILILGGTGSKYPVPTFLCLKACMMIQGSGDVHEALYNIGEIHFWNTARHIPTNLSDHEMKPPSTIDFMRAGQWVGTKTNLFLVDDNLGKSHSCFGNSPRRDDGFTELRIESRQGSLLLLH